MADKSLKSKEFVAIGVIIVLMLIGIFFRSIVNFVVDIIWYKEVGYLDTFYKILFSKGVLAIPMFVLIFVFLAIYLKFIKNKYLSAAQVAEGVESSKKATKWFFIGIAVLSAIMAWIVANAYWMEILKFINQTSFGQTDPIFNKDISFYVFTLPLISSVFSFAINVLAILIIITIAYFAVLYLTIPPVSELDFKVFGGDLKSTKSKITSNRLFSILSTVLMVVGALFFIVLGIKFYLDNFQLLYSERGAIFGAGYTDVKVTLWMNRIKSIGSIAMAIMLLIGIKGKSKQRIFVVGVSVLVITTVVGAGVEAGVQSFVVSPNELSKERPYIENSIKYTNLAYGMDKIEVRNFPVEQNLNIKQIEENKETITNISINDERPALEAFNQLQGMRGYYQFYDVDTDRYEINGETRQMFLSVRELNKERLDQNAQSWINSKLKYTHGYGLTVAPVNQINQAGQPQLIVKNVPVESSVPELRVDRPQIYYGELTNDYVIVNTDEDEFDYPKGDTNEVNEYEGDGGIQLNFLNRLLFSIKYGDFRLLISSGVHSDSRILINRNVVDRIKTIAPFLTFEDNAYAVVNDGNIYFVLDGYTTSNYYPYSEPYDESGINYIRNSVKAVVNAYDGSVQYYISDPEDPIIQTYNKIFNKMFLPLDEMEPSLRNHMRYPKFAFDVMSKMYVTYHATNPNVFYNREDKWAIPTETYQGEESLMEPLYFTFKLPEEEKAEFLLSIPFTPLGKQTLTAFMVARNDGDNYGNMVLYMFPKDRSIIGPQQIEAQISNNDVISRDLSLWNTQGSEVIRGHILTIPMENSILYVEPLYIRASSTTAIPEVKRIIVAYNSNIVMAESLELALEKIFGKSEGLEDDLATGEEIVVDGTDQEGEPTTMSNEQIIQRANDLYEQAQEALRNGSLSDYERLINELGSVLKEMQ